MTTFPDWSKFTPEAASAALPGLIEAAEAAVKSVEADTSTDYESLVWKLGDATRELWHTWGRVCHMLGVMNSDAWRKVEETFQPKLVEFSLRVSQSPALYAREKAVYAALESAVKGGAEVPPVRLRIVEKMIQGAELMGVGLEGEKKARFNAIQAELAKLGADFANAVIDATAAFKYEKDGKTYTIDDANYIEVMKHCADRSVREVLCRARATRAPGNAERIAKLLDLRRECAAILGFQNYAELSLATKCAPSVAAVLKMIDDLDAATVDIAKDEDAELATVQEPGLGEVQPWDITYLSEKLREKKYSYSEEELKRHFEFADVLKGLFRMAEFLFGVQVEEIIGEAKPSVWHPDVRFFAVKEDGREIAHFYLDPYVRPGLKQGGAWMNELCNRVGHLGLTPLSLMVLNYKLPDENGKTFMPMRDVETLFHEFGHALQCMLTRVDEEDAAGISLIEWDAVEVASQFMENWCLDDRTGIELPAELKAKVIAAKNFRAASACRRQLALAKTDLSLHIADKVDDANAVKVETFKHFGMPVVPEDIFLCGFTHIFSGGYSAGYYGYKWSEVMSADCYGAFEEAGLSDDAAMKSLGMKYRETILGLGGSVNALGVFRLFRGRDPGIDALLRQQGLK